jgi:hypothetical protein
MNEVWAVIDTMARNKDESIVAVFSSEQQLLEFTLAATHIFESGQFVVQPRVYVDPLVAAAVVKR